MIGNGFQFQQTAWANNAGCENLSRNTPITTNIFHRFPFGKNQTVGLDPVIGQVGSGAARSIGGLDPRNAARFMTVPEFVKPKGGEYFFVPSISSLTDTIGV